AGGAPPPAALPAGADLTLRQLSTGLETNIGNVGDFAFDKKGDWLAWTVDARDQIGNGVQVRSMTSDAVRPLDSDRAFYKRLTWAESGAGLAVLKGMADSVYTDTSYSVVTFTAFTPAGAKRTVFDPRLAKSFPSDQTVSPDRAPTWTDDASGLFFGTHALRHVKKTPPGATEEERPDLVIWHWKDPRLQSQQQVEEGRDKTYSYAAFVRVSDGQFVKLADDSVRDVAPSANGRFVTGTDSREYDLTGNLDGHRFHDIYAVDLQTGQRKVLAKKAAGGGGGFGGGVNFQSPDGSKLLAYADGDYWIYDLAAGTKRNITQGAATKFWDTEDDHNVVKPPIAPVGWTKDGASVLLSDDWDVWMVPVNGGPAANLTGNGKKDAIRYTRLRLDRDEKAIDVSKPLFFRAYGEWTKKEGIARVDARKPGALQLSLWGDAKVGLLKARDADVYVYTKSTATMFPDYYATDGSFSPGTRLTDANPQQKDFAWSSGAKLIDYVSDKGDKLQAALYLPANYQPGKSYPTLVYIYEKLSQNMHAYKAPSNTEALNVALYTSRGYAVLQPDIHYKVNDPGMSAVWCVVPALKAAIATGVVDSSHVALHGHSWGGYQTAFLVTQTNMFKAAIAGAPLTDMVSMYLSIYWNTGGGDMAIFEASQGRFTGAWWDNWDAYYRNTPIFAAKNVATPLVILHNDKDGAVDRMQGIEYYNTLRRMQKPVVMLEYKGENHGLAKPVNQKDYAIRMREFFDHYLQGAPAPSWWTDGVPHLKMEEHLKGRQRVVAEEKVQVP
ncbi:MAG: prolyl oligopeptidase family serine peptidase, partial [Gemmatimonadota bacterium]|nr:prolyl oligopeptidase family serine peptidase [Gemmatimonadota bacterium]